MDLLKRFQRTALLVLFSLFPTFFETQYVQRASDNITPYRNDYIEVPVIKIPLFLRDPAHASGPNGTLGFFIPLVFPLAAPFLLYRLKRTGFSGCRITVKDRGLLVFATR
jgi:hypothetical protein